MSRKTEGAEDKFGELTARIEQVRESMNLTRMAFCKHIEFPYTSYHHITGERRSKPTAELLTAVVSHSTVNPAWLLNGEGPQFRDGEEGSGPGAGYVLIPLYEVRGSAGEGHLVSGEEVEDLLAFKRAWITRELRTRPESLALIHVQGESMVPTLNPGDVILLELNEGRQTGDGVFVIRMGDTLLVKRLQFLPEGQVNVTSDNSAYQPFVVRLHQPPESFQIVGRVVWAGRRF
ncbi:MAG: helix-turn-helix transcriptional regulator [Deltaproteobacteria bacterium]|nr:helix-turn-helix transcriptional regulator [Deltaproteobacteria bacterium]